MSEDWLGVGKGVGEGAGEGVGKEGSEGVVKVYEGRLGKELVKREEIYGGKFMAESVFLRMSLVIIVQLFLVILVVTFSIPHVVISKLAMIVVESVFIVIEMMFV